MDLASVKCSSMQGVPNGATHVSTHRRLVYNMSNSVSGRDFIHVNSHQAIDENRRTTRRLSKNPAIQGRKACNRIRHSVLPVPAGMSARKFGAISLYAREGGRKYLNTAERECFLRATQSFPRRIRLFCRTLFWSGCRISELLGLTANTVDLDDGVIILRTLKRRQKSALRQVPLPAPLLRQLDREFRLRARQHDRLGGDERLWSWSRTTAWRHVKRVMASAEIAGPAAMPKGLRHAFGVAAFRSSVPPHLVQRWLGHASIETTSIYGDVAGKEEREFAARLWRQH